MKKSLPKPRPVNVQLAELKAGIAELERHEDPQRATARDCKHFQQEGHCRPRIGGARNMIYTSAQCRCPSECDAFKPTVLS